MTPFLLERPYSLIEWPEKESLIVGTRYPRNQKCFGPIAVMSGIALCAVGTYFIITACLIRYLFYSIKNED